MCYQKYHDCKYCKSPYVCDVDDYVCPSINHDVDMYMCNDCKERLESNLENIDLENVDLFEVDLKDFLDE